MRAHYWLYIAYFRKCREKKNHPFDTPNTNVSRNVLKLKIIKVQNRSPTEGTKTTQNILCKPFFRRVF